MRVYLETTGGFSREKCFDLRHRLWTKYTQNNRWKYYFYWWNNIKALGDRRFENIIIDKTYRYNKCNISDARTYIILKS